jgi:hypothetical protein
VSGFEIDVVDIVATCPIHNPADARPQASHRAHAARLQCAVDRVALQISGVQLCAEPADCHDFGMGGGIVLHLSLVERNTGSLTFTDERTTYTLSAGSALSLASSLYAHPHKLNVLLAGHGDSFHYLIVHS